MHQPVNAMSNNNFLQIFEVQNVGKNEWPCKNYAFSLRIIKIGDNKGAYRQAIRGPLFA
jgi:hypothetical protein